tara:strand:+ start:616 stop:996 length:381 start_codon:yes stop_codon:yes gene_type:complete
LIVEESIVFFDGPCTLCQKSVQWLARHEKSQSLKFAPLGGVTAKKFLNQALRTPPYEGVVFYHNQTSYTGSKAIVALAECLNPPWSFLMRQCPHWGYQLVAKNRTRIFSQNIACEWRPDLKNRILD